MMRSFKQIVYDFCKQFYGCEFTSTEIYLLIKMDRTIRYKPTIAEVRMILRSAPYLEKRKERGINVFRWNQVPKA
jgi:hypothetical protein